MQELDRLVWAGGTSVLSYGTRVGVRVTDAEALPDALARLPVGWKLSSSALVDRMYSVVVGGPGERPGVRRLDIVYANSARLWRGKSLENALGMLGRDAEGYVAVAAPRRVFVHAGVVGWRGRAILLPGGSCTGKTTLTAALLRAGATYHSDEYAVLDARGRVHPFPRPLGIRGDAVERDGTPAPGPVSAKRPLPVGLVVLTTYAQGKRFRPRRLSAGRGALELLAHTASARRRPEVVLETLGRAVTGVSVLKGSRGDADETAAAILARVERS